ncbi:hypothetical protein [Coleofasciculus sp.]|uniref:hypothetical protein n=1 Tax=Coleofasciculus sp. TaxID=3100458 RepID=UPI0040640A11
MFVRIDSGDIVALFSSGDMDEWEIARLLGEGATLDGYGIGTKLVSGERPYLLSIPCSLFPNQGQMT